MPEMMRTPLSPIMEEPPMPSGRSCQLCRGGSSGAMLMRVCGCARYVHEECQASRALVSPCDVCGEVLDLRPSPRYSLFQAVRTWLSGNLPQVTASLVAVLVLIPVAVACELYLQHSARSYQQVKLLRDIGAYWSLLVREPTLVTWYYAGAIILLSASIISVGVIVGFNVKAFVVWWWRIG